MRLANGQWRRRCSEALASWVLLLFLLFPRQGEAKEPTFIFIPAIANSKNDGVEGGLILPILYADQDGQINGIIAPMYFYNQYLGSRGTINLFHYPRRGEELMILGSYTERIERNFRGSYRNLYLSEGRYSLELRGGFFRNATARFFGLDSDSPETNETNYTDGEIFGQIGVGIYLRPDMRFIWTERFRDVDVRPGGVPGLPFIQSVFPGMNGVGGGTILGHKLAFLYDTRDHTVTPTIGSYFTLFAELGQFLADNTHSIFSRYGMEYRRMIPDNTRRYIFTFRGRLEATLGDSRIPFFERSSLGGRDSLRGYGDNRFYSNHSILFNFEERIRLLHLNIFDTEAELEIAPFLDVGKVIKTFRSHALSQYEFNPGVGLRAIARPNVVARVDVGVGREGTAVFAGLDYPF